MARRIMEPDRSLPPDGSSWVVLYREKAYPGGARRTWHHGHTFSSEDEAEREGIRLRQRGFHAIVERRRSAPYDDGVYLHESALEPRSPAERRFRSNRRG
jgi:hypothetical protein